MCEAGVVAIVFGGCDVCIPRSEMGAREACEVACAACSGCVSSGAWVTGGDAVEASRVLAELSVGGGSFPVAAVWAF